MMFPRWGTLLTYGRAEVIKKFFWPGMGNLQACRKQVREIEGKKKKKKKKREKKRSWLHFSAHNDFNVHSLPDFPEGR